MQIEKLKVGSIGYIIFPSVDSYDIFKQVFDFGQDFRLLEVVITKRQEMKMNVDGIKVDGFYYWVCLANEKDAVVFSGGGEPRPWDTSFDWMEFVGKTPNEAVRNAYQQNNIMVDGFLGIARDLESLIDPNEKVGHYNPKGKML